MSEITQLLEYCETNPNAKISLTASDMFLWAERDVSYLSEPKARSRPGFFFFLSRKTKKNPTPNEPPRNGTIYALAKIIRVFVGSAMEVEIEAVYAKEKEA